MATGINVDRIGAILVVGGALLIGWASRHQRTSPAPHATEPLSRRVEGGI
jgi:hypothetical protein